jgi:hypothetical protein
MEKVLVAIIFAVFILWAVGVLLPKEPRPNSRIARQEGPGLWRARPRLGCQPVGVGRDV